MSLDMYLTIQKRITREFATFVQYIYSKMMTIFQIRRAISPYSFSKVVIKLCIKSLGGAWQMDQPQFDHFFVRKILEKCLRNLFNKCQINIYSFDVWLHWKGSSQIQLKFMNRNFLDLLFLIETVLCYQYSVLKLILKFYIFHKVITYIYPLYGYVHTLWGMTLKINI